MKITKLDFEFLLSRILVLGVMLYLPIYSFPFPFKKVQITTYTLIRSLVVRSLVVQSHQSLSRISRSVVSHSVVSHSVISRSVVSRSVVSRSVVAPLIHISFCCLSTLTEIFLPLDPGLSKIPIKRWEHAYSGYVVSITKKIPSTCQVQLQ